MKGFLYLLVLLLPVSLVLADQSLSTPSPTVAASVLQTPSPTSATTTSNGAALDTDDQQTHPAPTGTPSAVSSVVANSDSKTSKQSTEKSTPDPYRGHYVDVSAAVFGWIAVIFALITLLIAIGAIVLSGFGIYKFRDLVRRLEFELRAKVDTAFQQSLDRVVGEEIRPRAKKIADEELNAVLEGARTRAHVELLAVVQQLDGREALVNEVVAEIQNRLKPADPMNQDEFEGHA